MECVTSRINHLPHQANSVSDVTRSISILRIADAQSQPLEDRVAVEEPLEIQLGYHLLARPARKSISITMRTPGDDRELALGFLYGEGIVTSPTDFDSVTHLDDDAEPTEESTNIIRVNITRGVPVDVGSLQRNFYTTSSCGVCGKASLKALEYDDCTPIEPGEFRVCAEVIAELPDRLRSEQPLFDETGGIHAAGLFDQNGELVELREDVGRHNAMDKLVGARLLAGALPAHCHIVVLSGRASFELLQKALRAAIPVVVAVGAPSSLAIDLATEFGITLVGFARNGRFNVYSHPHRIR